jgi:hypothetical protein
LWVLTVGTPPAKKLTRKEIRLLGSLSRAYRGGGKANGAQLYVVVKFFNGCPKWVAASVDFVLKRGSVGARGALDWDTLRR